MRLVQILAFMLLFAVIILFSCQKEFNCEYCLLQNQQPFANAGNDSTVRSPSPAVLNGTASFDPDGVINSYQWTRISGPSSYSIANPVLAETLVDQLQSGLYLFELEVTDDGGLSSRDTIQVIVSDPSVPNRVPVADAGPDQTINNTGNAFILNGSASSDPDNNIATFLWIQISGSVQVILPDPKQANIEAAIPGKGVYQFELTVTDSAGLFSKDTVQISFVESNDCEIAARPAVHARLIEIGTLSEARRGMVTAAAGSKILFAGGSDNGGHSARVDIFDFVQNTWSVAELSLEFRQGMVAAAIGDKILFAGGANNVLGMAYSTVDIYDTKTNIWTTAVLSQARSYLAAATVGDKILFAGGFVWINGKNVSSSIVDIYHNSTNTWSTAKLSEPRSNLTANTVGERIYFAGGLSNQNSSHISNRIDIFDASTNSWTTEEMVEARWNHAGIYFNNNLFLASGLTESSTPGYYLSNQVEIKNVNSGLSKIKCISGRYVFTAVERNNKIIFFTGYDSKGDKFDIYDPVTDSWTIGLLDQYVNSAAVISVNNKIYVAGGTDGGNKVYNKVWTLEW